MNADDARAKATEYASLNAFISFTTERGHGPAIGVKDVIDVRGTVTTAGSRVFRQTPAECDAEVIQTSRQGGCIVMGKTNLHEWALGPTSENLTYGAVRNPWDQERMAGGSSGGSAAAVAAGLCDWAIGTDTGGSIRIPASFCGVVGLRPTLGLVSTSGVVPVSPTLDTVGPLARDVDTVTQALEAMTGENRPLPENSFDEPSVRVAIPSNWIGALDSTVQAMWGTVSNSIPEIDFPDIQYMRETADIICCREAASYHRTRLESRSDEYDPSILENFLRKGLEISRRDYVLALREQRRIATAIERALSGYHALVMPTTPCVAPKLGSAVSLASIDQFTYPLSLVGNPVVSIPGPSDSLPVGIQMVGHFGDDHGLLNAARGLARTWA